MEQSNFDSIDKEIIRLLQQNAKLGVKEIAKEIGLTITPTYERLKRIELSGIIQSYVALVDFERISNTIMVFCNVTLSVHTRESILNFEEKIRIMPEVLSCYHITGNHDYLLQIIVKDMKNYQLFIIEKLSTIENVANVNSNFVMSAIKQSTQIPIN